MGNSLTILAGSAGGAVYIDSTNVLGTFSNRIASKANFTRVLFDGNRCIVVRVKEKSY